MRAFALIQALTSGHAPGHRGSLGRRSGSSEFSRWLNRWLDRHGAAVGFLAVLLTFVGAVELVEHVLTLL